MILLITGQPGHGKTQYAISLALKHVKEGRTVYAGNIKGLKYETAGFVPLERFQDWESLPDGAVILWDECYDALPQRAAGRAVPSYIDALARHRHRGFDFILVCQQPKQLDSFISGLIERHIHCRRKYGTKWVRLLEWDKWQRDTDRASPMQATNWALDPTVWQYYESATQHTGKVRVPRMYFWLLGLLIAVLFAVWAIPTSMANRAKNLEGGETRDRRDAPATGLAWGLPQQSPVDEETSKSLRYTDPLAYIRPRVSGLQWTAPAYDSVPFGDPIRMFCYISHKTKRGTCRCVSQQNTTISTPDDLCRLAVDHGIYDPFRVEPQTAPVAQIGADQTAKHRQNAPQSSM